MNIHFLELITSVERSSEGTSEASDRASEQGEPQWHSTTFFQVQRRFGSLSLGLNSWKHFLFQTFVETHSNTIHFKYLFKLIETIYESTRFPFLAKTGLAKVQKTCKNIAKINTNRSGGSMKTQKTYKHLCTIILDYWKSIDIYVNAWKSMKHNENQLLEINDNDLK